MELVVDAHRRVWVAESGLGLRMWDGKQWNYFGVEDGLPSDRVTCLALDGHRLWIGTEDQGLYRLRLP